MEEDTGMEEVVSESWRTDKSPRSTGGEEKEEVVGKSWRTDKSPCSTGWGRD